MKSFGQVESWVALAMLPGVLVGLGHVWRSTSRGHRWWLRAPGRGAAEGRARLTPEEFWDLGSATTQMMISVYILGGALLAASADGVFPPALGAWVIVLGVLYQASVSRVLRRGSRAAVTAGSALFAGVVLATIWVVVQVDSAAEGTSLAFFAWFAYALPLALGLLVVGWQSWVAAELFAGLPPAQAPVATAAGDGVYAVVPDQPERV